ncbi:DUF397 domain-containing protein [Streptomyces montanisoli]|uniref:DUF397 domain-containing protein n=1 Tax=Streptomyces montanisoli TaxID=2798581 RepID=A0A940MDE8_9ACTN|nr:DUF397 domain-containing protein [Streptomyces montanisoli]MBP0457572.1 DUF397 domain-containing protein [Streptomyces montanisoli]
MTRHPVVGDHYALEWFKSSYSSSEPDSSCVEIAAAPQTVHVRDSKDVAGGRLRLTPDAWTQFVAYASGQALTRGHRCAGR